jgi:hypothetical protein
VKTISALTEADNADYIGDPYFERGQNYYRNGHIFDPVRRGQQIQGYCASSEAEPYRVIVSFNKDGLSGDSCSCPMGGGCKHVVTLLEVILKTMFEQEANAGQLDKGRIVVDFAFVANNQAPVVLQPSICAFNQPAALVAAQRSTVLGAALAVSAMGGNQFNASSSKACIMGITVVSAVADKTSGFSRHKTGRKSRFNEGDFS